MCVREINNDLFRGRVIRGKKLDSSAIDEIPKFLNILPLISYFSQKLCRPKTRLTPFSTLVPASPLTNLPVPTV